MKLTIKMFQDLEMISRMDMDEIDKSQLLVQTMTGLSVDQLNNMDKGKYNKLCKKVNEAFELKYNKTLEHKPKNLVRVRGKWYWLNYDLAKPPMNTGRYVELATFSGDFIGNMHKIMASMATPVKWTFLGIKPLPVDSSQHEAIAEDMLHMDFKHGYHAAVFFWAVFSKSILNSRNYFLSITKDKTEMEMTLTNLQRISDGYIKARWLKNLKVYH
jgi:muconolactone delta-isomerase